MFKYSHILIITLTFATSCKSTHMQNSEVKAPTVAKKNKEFNTHGDYRVDPYYWLNERENPEVIAYLEAENKYYESQTAHTKAFQDELFEEMKARLKEDDESVPYKRNGYFYITRFVKGGQYPIFQEKKIIWKHPKKLCLTSMSCRVIMIITNCLGSM
jgi:oligopeptidase B